MDPRKSKKIKSILGFLQEDVPGAPVDATSMDEPLPPDEADQMPSPGVPAAPPVSPDEDELLMAKRKRRGIASPDAFNAALSPRGRSY